MKKKNFLNSQINLPDQVGLAEAAAQEESAQGQVMHWQLPPEKLGVDTGATNEVEAAALHKWAGWLGPAVQELEVGWIADKEERNTVKFPKSS